MKQGGEKMKVKDHVVGCFNSIFQPEIIESRFTYNNRPRKESKKKSGCKAFGALKICEMVIGKNIENFNNLI